MDVQVAVRTLRAVREFKPDPVPETVVRAVLEAGRLSASGKNVQPWHFTVVQERATLAELGHLARTGPYIAQAPVAIVVTITPGRLAVSDASRAIQSMLLVAWAAGVGSNWVGFGGLDPVKPLLGIPDTLEVLAILPLGYPASGPGKGKKERKPLSEVASRERFDQPYT
jgi:nitroreductase